ncbi:MAG: SGNH/GDSL hydrolase family protein [Candidatus Eremiobacteraeota bacterium]|nr:SGNH/GDSL hydrolase family protein [Candidatus Eremiobacteraeota bacterium]
MKKNKNGISIIGTIILIIYIMVVIVSMYYISSIHFPFDKLKGHFHLKYPPGGSEYIAICGFLFMSGFALISHFVIVKKLKGWKKAVAIILVVMLFFGVIEYFLKRHVRLHPLGFNPHPYLLWVMNPRVHPESLNSRFLRYSEFPDKKEKNEFRFLVLGDSSAYGHGVQDGERFSDVLEEKLREKFPDKKIRVINAAVQGYSIFQGRNLYELELKQTSPDGLIISFNNDINFCVIKDEEGTPTKLLRPIFMLLYKSDLFLLMKKLMLSNREQKDLDECRHRYKKGENKNKIDAGWRVPEKDIRRHYSYLINDMKKRGKQTIIISMPQLKHELDYTKEVLGYREIIKNIADKNGALFVDVFNEWRDDPEINKLFVDPHNDKIHPDYNGHEKIAEQLYEKIQKRRIIK